MKLTLIALAIVIVAGCGKRTLILPPSGLYREKTPVAGQSTINFITADTPILTYPSQSDVDTFTYSFDMDTLNLRKPDVSDAYRYGFIAFSNRSFQIRWLGIFLGTAPTPMVYEKP